MGNRALWRGLYRRNALQLHVNLSAKAPLGARHFDRWLDTWTTCVDEHFAGEKAELAKLQGHRIAASIQRRVNGGSGSAFQTIGLRTDTVNSGPALK